MGIQLETTCVGDFPPDRLKVAVKNLRIISGLLWDTEESIIQEYVSDLESAVLIDDHQGRVLAKEKAECTKKDRLALAKLSASERKLLGLE